MDLKRIPERFGRWQLDTALQPRLRYCSFYCSPLRGLNSYLTTLILLLLSLGVLSAPAADMVPVSVAGFNRDLVIENTATGPPYTAALELNPNENTAFYQSGLSGKSYGFPLNGTFSSALADGTTFQLAPYTSSNALVMSGGTGVDSGTLTLGQPGAFLRIAILANSASGGGTANLTLNFADGSSIASTYAAPDWFNNSNFALSGFERINLTSGVTQGAPSNPRLYQTTIDLTALGASTRVLSSITFERVAGAGSTAIYAVSGEQIQDYSVPPSFSKQPASTNVDELAPASFSVSATGLPAPALQWYRNGQPIPGATLPTYSLASCTMSDTGAEFRAVASSIIQSQTVSATSTVAVLTVRADTNPPALVTARSLGLGEVQLLLSERVSVATATNAANYSLAGPEGTVTISGATLAANQSNVVLAISMPLIEGTNYTLVVNGLSDLSAAANRIPSNSTTNFIAVSWRPEDVGGALPLGGPAWTPGGVNITGGGKRIGGVSDEFQFSQSSRTGDFDVSVRVESLGLTDPWAQAGLMARESLAVGSPFAAVFSTPSLSGCFFEARTIAGSASARSGSFPANYPAMWLRLARAGAIFTGYASIDGKRWTQLGQSTLSLPATVYFGYAVSSRAQGTATVAAFREMTNVVSAATAPLATDREPLGQCSRRTPLVISEIMYHPPDRLIGTNTAQLEFIEIYNSRGEPEDLSGFRIAGDVDYTFPSGTVLAGGAFLVIARSPSDLAAITGFAGALGPWNGAATNGLPNNNGTVRLLHRTGAVLLKVDYESAGAWPVAADGAGHSLVLARPSYGEGNPKGWAASDQVLGSPGRLDPLSNDPRSAIRINEFLAHTDDPEVDYIELYNHSTAQVDIGGCVLSDDAALDGYIIPQGTSIDPGGFLYFTQTTLGFSLKAEGETIYFSDPTGTRVIDAVRFQGQENGVATGRWPDGADAFYRMAAKTPGQNNSVIRPTPVNINELMYKPISGDDNDQYVELYNSGAAAVDLSGWRLEDGISFTFPPNTMLAANSYLVVARNAAHLRTNYAVLNAANCLGNFGGNFSGKGERIALSKPDQLASFSNGRWQTNTIHIVMDEVSYEAGGAWGQWADGGGSSLELKDPRADRRLAANWADSEESGKAPWGVIERTGIVDNGNVAANQLQVLLLGAGECLIDNIEVIGNGGTNRIANGTFESGTANWTAQGTESGSGWETAEGYNSLRSYRVRAVDRGDNQVNRIRVPLTTALSSGEVATLRARVRWLKGHGELCLRLRGNWLEAVGPMPLPLSPGTPGERNSRAVSNAGPAIYDVGFSPILPAENEPVVVTARVNDPDGVGPVTLAYRVDPSSSGAFATMRDDGFAGDSIAGDGIYSATIPGQLSGRLVAFYVQAGDQASAPASARYPSDAPTRECLVRWGENQPSGNLPVYRIWMTQTTFNTWSTRLELDNTPNNVTFVLGNQRVIQTTLAQFAGSPYISGGFDTPSGKRCGYSISFPPDDPFLGGKDLVLDWPGGHGRENTAVQEQMAYFIADRMNLPFSYRHYIRLQVNGVTDMQRGGVFEAVLQPAASYLDQWNPGDSDGEFYKIDRGFEFNDSNTLAADPMPRLESYVTTNPADGSTIKKTEKYRWTWLKRSYDTALDYTNLLFLVDALNATGPEPYTSQTASLLNIDQVMGTFAFEHIINNFDSWGHAIGKNMYFYKPGKGGWQLYPFDLDWLMLVSVANNSIYANGNGPLFTSEDPTVTRLYNNPPFLRAYLRAVQAAVDGPMLASASSPAMDAKYASLVANGVTLCDGQTLVSPDAVKTWFQQRRSFLLGQLANYSAPFAVSGSTTLNVTSNLVTLSGTAPVGAKTIVVDGVAWPVTWTTVSNWTLRLPVSAGTAQHTVSAKDSSGNILPGASQVITISYSGTVPPPAGAVVISEIMANPVVPDAEYVELFNTSTQTTHDLSGCVFNGIDYTFPQGSYIAPRTALVLVKDRLAFAVAHGYTIVPFGQFSGNLQVGGETLTLSGPDTPTGPGAVIAKVRYEGSSPWPNAATNGSALQLIDTAQDIWRPANWLAGAATQPAPAQWQFYTTNFSATSSTLYLYLGSAGDIYVDDIKLAIGTGANTLANGGFESPLGTTWNLTANFAPSTLSTEVHHGGNSSLHIVATAAGSGSGNGIYQQIVPALTLNQTYTLSFWYLQSTNGGPFFVRLSNSSTPARVTPAPPPLGNIARATPGVANAVFGSLSPFPPLWINEIQPQNVTGITNSAGQRAPWIELFNPSSNTLSLRGLFLADNFTNLTQWPFPTDATIGPRQFKLIFADGQTALSSASELHTSFVLSPGVGALALTRIETNATLQVLDYTRYTAPENRSWGSIPDGQSFVRQQMYYVTPGASNNAASPPLVARINEWMADNASTIADPADSQFQDWFEIYNPGSATIDLGGYYLTDDLAQKFQFQVPSTGRYQIPPGGYLLVWADGEAAQNTNTRPDLHVSFKLAKEGEAIGLFAADGTPIDFVTFGSQTTGVSEGRSPDGSGSIGPLTVPTPGTANLLPNTNPVMQPIADRYAYVGQTVVFPIAATDAEAPPQGLTFSLDPGSASGATIQPLTGLFSWVPGSAQLGTNRFTVRVTDSGIPPLSGTGSFAIVVNSAPDFGYAPGPGGTVELKWTGLPGNIYRLQYQDNLGSAGWFNLGPDQTGTGQPLSATINMGDAPRRFYRLLILQ